MHNTSHLSKREEDVAKLLQEGKGNKNIAATLGISEHTVEFHLTHIYAKLGVASRAEAIVQLGESRASRRVEDPGISVVEEQGDRADNGSELKLRRATGSDGTVGMKPSWMRSCFQPYTIFVAAGLLALACLMLVYAKQGLLENLASEICIGCSPDGGPVPSQSIVQSYPLPGSRSGRVPSLSITPSTPLPSSRSRLTATRLLDGKILVVGGYDVVEQTTANAVIFDPVKGSFQAVASIHTPRHDHTATLLRDGRVLVIGGYTLPQQWLADAEIYDPNQDTWTVVPPLHPHGVSHAATMMRDGRVLVAGGCIGDSVCTAQVEIFDPETNSWTDAAPLPTDRASQTAQLLRDGRVLVSGGWGARGPDLDDDALLYDPQADTWTATGPMVRRRCFAQSVRLLDGQVLVLGGLLPGGGPNSSITTSAETYDPVSDTWTAAADAQQARWGFSMVLLNDGKALAIGGADAFDNEWNDGSLIREIELYDPALDTWKTVGFLPRPVAVFASTLLPGNRVWVAGGQTPEASWANTWIIRLSE